MYFDYSKKSWGSSKYQKVLAQWEFYRRFSDQIYMMLLMKCLVLQPLKQTV